MSKSHRLTPLYGILAAALAVGLCAPPLMAQSVRPSLQSVASPTGGLPVNPAQAQMATQLPVQAPSSDGVTVAPNPTAAPALTPVQTAIPGQLPASGQAAVPGTYAQQGGVAVQPNLMGAGTPPGQVPSQELPPLPTPASEFPKVLDDHLGVTPSQIRNLHQTIDDRQRAAGEWLNPPRAVRSSISVSLSPGSQPPVIRPYMGAASSFVVVDSSGQPWPVENVHPGNPALFTLERLDGPQGSSFTLDALQPYGQSNLILKLVGVATPVVINLIAGQRVQDASVEVRVQGRGPNAMAPTVSGSLPPGTDARLLPVLDGIAPSGGSPLTVMGADNVKAWLLPSGHMMVRASFKLLSPVLAATSSSDGTTVYELAATPKLLGLINGNYVYLTVTGW